MPLALIVLIWVGVGLGGLFAVAFICVLVYAFVIAKMMKDFH